MRPYAFPDLPLVPFLPAVAERLARDRLLVLCAEPGSGKTTLVPPFLALLPEFPGRILVLEPRRLAAAAAAQRVAELFGDRVGGIAGYRVRYETRVSSSTRIEFLTEALLTRAIQDDPGLDGVSALVFDEFHERSVHADLALALALEVRGIRPDLAILLMSATLETERLASFLGCGSITAPGRAFPVETRYRAMPEPHWERSFAEGVVALAGETPGDVLAFLPGMAQMLGVAALLRETGTGLEIRLLHGSMPLDEQRAVLAPPEGTRKRVVLATNVAETSLTVPRVTAVADSGWARVARFHPRSGMDRLTTERIPGDRADQRRGRAGRLGPGKCVRFWNENEVLSPAQAPEILRTELARTALEIAFFGERDPRRLRWPDPPPDASWNAARNLLQSLGMVDDVGNATEPGRKAAAWGLHPRLAAIVGEGIGENRFDTAAAAAVLLSERDSGGRDRGEGPLVDTLERFAAGNADGPDERASFERAGKELARLSGSVGRRWNAHGVDPGSAATAIAAGYPDRLARLVGDGLYAFPSGRRARMAPTFPAAEWIVAPEVDAGDPEGVIRLALPLAEGEVAIVLAGRTTTETPVEWDGWKAKAFARTKFGRITVSERTSTLPDRSELAAAVAERVRREGFASLPLDGACGRFLSRVRFAARAAPERALPDFSDRALAASADGWLSPFVTSDPRGVIDAGAVLDALRARAGPENCRFLAREVPDRLETPAGSSRFIDYPPDADPRVEAKIQELFGLREGPRLLGRPLVFLLLSPASRPLQTTSDLGSFWRTAYPEIREPMRTRYPKHRWPEDPLSARPTAGVRRGR